MNNEVKTDIKKLIMYGLLGGSIGIVVTALGGNLLVTIGILTALYIIIQLVKAE